MDIMTPTQWTQQSPSLLRTSQTNTIPVMVEDRASGYQGSVTREVEPCGLNLSENEDGCDDGIEECDDSYNMNTVRDVADPYIFNIDSNSISDRRTPPPSEDAGDTMSSMESLIRSKVPDTAFLKGALKVMNVSGLPNAPFSGKVSAIAARMLQYNITFENITDAIDAKEEAAAVAHEGNEALLTGYETAIDESALACSKRCQDALEKLSRLPKDRASFKKNGSGTGATALVTWATSAASPRFEITGPDVRVMRSSIDLPYENLAAPSLSGAPLFYASEHERLLHVLLDARMTNERRLLSRPRDRDDLDREPVCPWDSYIVPLFNDEAFSPEANIMFCVGITSSNVSGIDPSRREHVRNATTLIEKWAKLKSSYTRVLANFERSGQMEADVFPRFSNGNSVLMYFHSLIRTPVGSIIESMATMLIEQNAREEVGVGHARGEMVPERGSSRKRSRDSSRSTKSKIHVRGLEGIGVGMRSRFQAKHFETAEASKSNAENVRAILMALNVKSMMSDITPAGDESLDKEWQSYVETKNELLIQLSHLRLKEKERQRGCDSEDDEE